MENVEAQSKSLVDKLMGAEMECGPSKMVDAYADVRQHQRTNMDKSTVQAERKKIHRMWQRYLETRDSVKYKEYTKQRNKVREMTSNSDARNYRPVMANVY